MVVTAQEGGPSVILKAGIQAQAPLNLSVVTCHSLERMTQADPPCLSNNLISCPL